MSHSISIFYKLFSFSLPFCVCVFYQCERRQQQQQQHTVNIEIFETCQHILAGDFHLSFRLLSRLQLFCCCRLRFSPRPSVPFPSTSLAGAGTVPSPLADIFTTISAYIDVSLSLAAGEEHAKQLRLSSIHHCLPPPTARTSTIRVDGLTLTTSPPEALSSVRGKCCISCVFLFCSIYLPFFLSPCLNFYLAHAFVWILCVPQIVFVSVASLTLASVIAHSCVME